MKKAFYIAASAALLLLIVVFAFWIIEKNNLTVPSMITSTLCTLIVGVLLVCFIEKLIDFWVSKEQVENKPLYRKDRLSLKHPWVKITVWMIISRLAVFLIAYFIYCVQRDYQGGIIDVFDDIWLRCDSPSYLGIAERWYVTEGDPMYHIVFFPFYPCLIKLFSFVIGDYFLSAMAVSFVTSILAANVLYELIAIDYDRRTAMKTVLFTFMMPAALFFSAPMTESVFLLVSVTSLLFLRKKNYLLAGLFGALAAFTRSVGAVLVVPIGIEAVRDIIEFVRLKKCGVKQVLPRALSLIIVPLGIVGYLIINETVWGDPFKFLEIQQDHWNQSFGLFFNTVEYQTRYFIDYLNSDRVNAAFGLWFSNLFCIFASLIVMIIGRKKMRVSYMGFFGAYFIIAIGVTWLLSAPRYMLVMFPIGLSLATVTNTKLKECVTACVLSVLALLYLVAFVAGGFQIW